MRVNTRLFGGGGLQDSVAATAVDAIPPPDVPTSSSQRSEQADNIQTLDTDPPSKKKTTPDFSKFLVPALRIAPSTSMLRQALNKPSKSDQIQSMLVWGLKCEGFR